MKTVLLGSNNKPAIRIMYENTNCIVEKLSKTIYFATIGFSLPSCILPKAISSYYIYFTTDSADDAFQLPFIMW